MPALVVLQATVGTMHAAHPLPAHLTLSQWLLLTRRSAAGHTQIGECKGRRHGQSAGVHVGFHAKPVLMTD